MKNLIGSEKQIKWAQDLRARGIAHINRHLEGTLFEEYQKEVFRKRLEWLEAEESASKIISICNGDLWDEIGLDIPD